MTYRRSFAAALFAMLLTLVVAGCGGDDEDGQQQGAQQQQQQQGAQQDPNVSGNVQVAAVWSGPEQESFQAVLDEFQERHPNVRVRYNSAGDQLPTVLATAVEGGNPPDIAVLPQPGLARDFVQKGALKPLTFAQQDIRNNFSEDWIRLGTIQNQLYGLFFKGANKSTVWFNTQIFEDAGVQQPQTWDQFLQTADTVKASGVAPFSVGGADGWTLTDLFENIYLRTAGPDMYDRLAEHEIPWTDESVKQALREMARVVGQEDNVAGNALQTDFPESVTQVFSDQPQAAMVIEGDFVGGVIRDQTDAQDGEFDVFEFPSFGNEQGRTVMGGGDMVVMFRDSPAAQALIRYLASPEAAQIWARRGGFSSPNQNLDPSAYPDEISRRVGSALAQAETFRFDLSDLAPASFGATPGQGMWKALQDFLRETDVDATAQQLERLASKAYRKDAERGAAD